MRGEESDCHSLTYVTIRQLVEFDYEIVMLDRRVTRQETPNFWNETALAEEGEGEHMTVRDFLGEKFFAEIECMKKLGDLDDVRVIFWFDN